jgi:hypothetical protein
VIVSRHPASFVLVSTAWTVTADFDLTPVGPDRAVELLI